MTDLTVGRVTFGHTPKERATSLLKEDAVFEFTFSAQRKDAARLIAKQIREAEQAAAEKARREEREACARLALLEIGPEHCSTVIADAIRARGEGEVK